MKNRTYYFFHDIINIKFDIINIKVLAFVAFWTLNNMRRGQKPTPPLRPPPHLKS